RGEAQRPVDAARERDHRLHRTLAERARTDDARTLLILQRTGDDFRSRGRAFVDENDDRQGAGKHLARTRVVALRVTRAAAARGDDFALIEECVRNVDRLIKQPARIVAQVDHDAFELAADLRLRLIDRTFQTVFGLLVERCDADIGDIVFRTEANAFDAD